MQNLEVKVCRVKELKPGMRLYQDVHSDSGITLLPENSVLTYSCIGKLELWGIEKVLVYEEVIEAIRESADDIVFGEVYQQTLDTTENMFNELRAGGRLPVDDCLQATSLLLSEIMDKIGVMRRLHHVKKSDAYTFNHSVNVSIISTLIGMWLGYRGEELRLLTLSGLLHDIGKSKISLEILNKPSKLSDDEFFEIQKHTIYGYEVVYGTPGINRFVSDSVLQHHEREDGNGYPLRLTSTKITRYAKIIAVADIYDAMTSERVYKRRVSPYKVAEMIAENSFGELDPVIARTFLANIANNFIGNIVKLSTGDVGEVIYINPLFPTKPLVKVGDKFINLQENRDIKVEEVL